MGDTNNSENSSKQEETVEIKRQGWGVRHVQVACMCMCVTAMFMVQSSMGIAVIAMTDINRKNESIIIYDWDHSSQSIILTSFFWGYVVMQIPGGILSKMFGGKPILLFAMIANGLLCLLVPTLASLGGWQLVSAARVAIGLTQACLYPAIHTLLGQWLPDQERVLLPGVVYGGTHLGGILGMPVADLMAGTSIGWPLVFYAMAGLMACIAILWYLLTGSTPAQHRFITSREQEYIEMTLNKSQSGKRVRTPWLAILRSRSFLALVVTHTGVACGFDVLLEIPFYLRICFNVLSEDKSYSAFHYPYIGMWVGCLLSSVIGEVLYNRGILSATACRKVLNSAGVGGFCIGLTWLSFIGPDFFIIADRVVIFVFTMFGFTQAGFMINHLDLSPNFAGVLMSFTNFIALIVSGLMPLISQTAINGDLSDMNGWRIVFLLTAGIVIFSNIIFVIFGTAERQPWDDPNFLNKRDAEPEEMMPVICSEQENQGDAENNFKLTELAIHETTSNDNNIISHDIS